MKPLRLLSAVVFLFLGSVLLAQGSPSASSLIGAWRITGAPERVMIITPNYWSETSYDRAQRQFVRTFGGTYELNGATSKGVFQFDSQDSERVGTRFQVGVRVVGDEL